MEKQIFENSFA